MCVCCSYRLQSRVEQLEREGDILKRGKNTLEEIPNGEIVVEMGEKKKTLTATTSPVLGGRCVVKCAQNIEMCYTLHLGHVKLFV